MKSLHLKYFLFSNMLNNETTLEPIEWERLKNAIFIVIVPTFIFVQYLFLPKIPFTIKKWILEQSPLIQNLINVYPVIVEHNTFSKPKSNQIPVYSSITSGGSGGLTKEFGFHTLTDSDTFLISNSQNQESNQQTVLYKKNAELQIHKNDNSSIKEVDHDIQNKIESSKKNPNESNLPLKIPANYRFRNDFALRWDQSATISIASVELQGYTYFRNMLKQIRENFSPPGLNLVWRDSAGLVISQTIKPQIVKVLFLLDEEGTVRDVKIVSSMGQKPVDDACIRVLLNQNFGKPPKEIFEYGNIFGINFIFPPIY